MSKPSLPGFPPCSSVSVSQVHTACLGCVQSEVSNKKEIRKGSKERKHCSPVQTHRLTFQQPVVIQSLRAAIKIRQTERKRLPMKAK